MTEAEFVPHLAWIAPFVAMLLSIAVLPLAAPRFWESNARKLAVAALRKMSADQATVLRDGQHRQIPATELVRGDILLIEEGDTIPADAGLCRACERIGQRHPHRLGYVGTGNGGRAGTLPG